MSSVIIELQRESLDQNVPVSNLLRKALVVARKLKLSEFHEWIENELNGYQGEVPDYRMASGQVKGWNPYNGWIPLIFEDSKQGEAYSKRGGGQRIAEIEDLIRGDDKKSMLQMPFPLNIQRSLSKGFGFETQVSLFVDRGSLVRILDAVRNIILNWALKLEEDGILGEGLSFSNVEKEVAVGSTQNVNNFYGAVQNTQIAQGSEHAIQVSSTFQVDPQTLGALIRNVESAMPDIILSSDDKVELESEIATLKAQVASPKPKKGIVKESLSSVRSLLESAGGSATGQLLIEVGKMLFS